jgi:hypothetical protein
MKEEGEDLVAEGVEEVGLVEDPLEVQEVAHPVVEDHQAEVDLVAVEEVHRLVVEGLVDPLVGHLVGNMDQGETYFLSRLASRAGLRNIVCATKQWIVERHQFK